MTTRLQRKWLDVGIDRYPVERVDLLDRLKVFGDVRRPSRFHLGPDILPVVDVTPFTEQVPAFFSRSGQGAVAAQLSTYCLQNTSGIFGPRRIVARPKTLKMSSTVAQQVLVSLATSPFAAIVQRTVRFSDSRRGIAAAVLGVDRGCITGSTTQVGAIPSSEALMVNLAANLDSYVPVDWLNLIFVAPGVDLVVQSTVVNLDLDVSIAWFEEPVAGVTRVLG